MFCPHSLLSPGKRRSLSGETLCSFTRRHGGSREAPLSPAGRLETPADNRWIYSNIIRVLWYLKPIRCTVCKFIQISLKTAPDPEASDDPWTIAPWRDVSIIGFIYSAFTFIFDQDINTLITLNVGIFSLKGTKEAPSAIAGVFSFFDLHTTKTVTLNKHFGL